MSLIEEKMYDLENKNKIKIVDYSFLNSNRLASVEIEEEIEAHKYRKINEIFFEAMETRYRCSSCKLPCKISRLH